MINFEQEKQKLIKEKAEIFQQENIAYQLHEQKIGEINMKIKIINYKIKRLDNIIADFNTEKELTADKAKIKELAKKIKNINHKIMILEKEKKRKYKNILFQMISLGVYNRKKIINEEINKLKLEEEKDYSLKTDLEAKHKTIFITDTNGAIYQQLTTNNCSFDNKTKAVINKSILNLENQPSTSKFKEDSLNI